MGINFPIIIPPAGDAQNSDVLRQFRLLDRSFLSSTDTTATGTIGSSLVVVTSSSATTQTLPSAVDTFGSITVKNMGAGVVTISPLSGQTIDGRTAAHLMKYQCITLRSNGSNWFVVSLLSGSYS